MKMNNLTNLFRKGKMKYFLYFLLFMFFSIPAFADLGGFNPKIMYVISPSLLKPHYLFILLLFSLFFISFFTIYFFLFSLYLKKKKLLSAVTLLLSILSAFISTDIFISQRFVEESLTGKKLLGSEIEELCKRKKGYFNVKGGLINTYKTGCYRCNPLKYGITNCPELFQFEEK